MRSREELERRIKEVTVRDFETCEIWLALAEPLIGFLEREKGPNPALKVSQLRETAKAYLENVLGKLDHLNMVSIAPRDDWGKYVQPFERFSSAVGAATGIAGIKYETEVVAASNLGPLILSALAFSNASLARRSGSVSNTAEYFVSEAIRHAPEEPVLYYFRSRWREERWVHTSILEGRDPNLPDKEELATWVDDLEIAVRLSLDWDEPKKRLLLLKSEHKLP